MSFFLPSWGLGSGGCHKNGLWPVKPFETVPVIKAIQIILHLIEALHISTITKSERFTSNLEEFYLKRLTGNSDIIKAGVGYLEETSRYFFKY